MEHEEWKNWDQQPEEAESLRAKNRRQKGTIFLLWILVAALIGGNVFQYSYRQASSYDKLQEVQDLIDEKYIGEADPTDLEDAAAAAMVLATQDRWSYYIPAADVQAHKEAMANAYVGVGITILVDQKEDGFYIQQVNPGGPAHEAGLLPGDILMTIGGKPVKGMESDEARDLIRGKVHSTVDVTVLRGEETIPFTLERRNIEVAVATGKMVTENIGLVTILNFDDRCAEETIGAIKSLQDQGAEKLIFDVRFNPGGYAHELVKLLDFLLPEGDLFTTVDYRGKKQVDRSDKNFLDLPMMVLVNGDSYSAAEFFAAALREYGAAQIVGEKTSGKGRFQQTHYLQDGSAVNLSVGKYFTPNGENLEGVGLTPDVEVTVDQETAGKIVSQLIEPEDDPQLQAAIRALEEK